MVRERRNAFLSTVLAVGYFNNADDDLNLGAEDMIWVQAGDGNMWLRVSSVDSAGVVTTQFAGGNLPIQTPGTGTAVAAASRLLVGYYEIGTSISSATRYVLPTPYPGAEVRIYKDDSGTEIMNVEAGDTATGAGGTEVTYDSAGNRRFVLTFAGEGFHVVGSSTSRWRIMNMTRISTHSSASAHVGASAFLTGT